ncbi:MAG: diguanylate cyclase [Candidatus Methylomirabilales bacterium]
MLFSLIVPGGLLLAATVAFLHWVASPGLLSTLVRVYPYAVYGAGLLLGWRFRRSRLLFAILLLAVVDRGLLHFAFTPPPTGAQGRIVFNAAGVLLPLNLAILSLVSERGLFTPRGLWRLGILLVQPFLVAFLCQPAQASVAALLEHPLIGIAVMPGLRVTQPVLFAFAGAFLVVTTRFIRHPHGMASAFVWALTAAFLALNASSIGPVSTIYFATAGLILVISVIETSYSMAYRDELTGLPARRALNEALPKLGSQYTVAMLDIDRFKKFNDQYGHDAGDQLLRMVASKLAKASGGGKAFRYGGEEFAMLFPGMSVQDAIPRLQELRKIVEMTGFTLRESDRPRKKPKELKSNNSRRKTLSVTISIGVAERTEEHPHPEAVIEAADQALYRAKRAGRNRLRT